MKFTIEAAALKDALGACGKVVERSAKIPILQHIFIGAANGLEFRATNMDAEISRWTAGHISVTGSICVDHTKLSAWTAALADGAQVEAELRDARLKFRSGRASISLQTLPGADFPNYRIRDDLATFDLPAADREQILAPVAAASTDDVTRTYLAGIHLQRVADRLRSEATDGKLLFRYHVPLPEGARDLPDEGVIVHISTVRLIKAIFGGQDVVSVSVSAEQIIVKTADTMLKSKMIDGIFPEVDKIIPTFSPSTSTSGDELLGALRRILPALASDDKSSTVRVVAEGNEMSLHTASGVGDEAVDSIEIDPIPEPRIFGTNSRQILTILATLGPGDIEIDLGPTMMSPLLIRPMGDPDRLALCMPVRIAVPADQRAEAA